MTIEVGAPNIIIMMNACKIIYVMQTLQWALKPSQPGENTRKTNQQHKFALVKCWAKKRVNSTMKIVKKRYMRTSSEIGLVAGEKASLMQLSSAHA